MANEYNVSLMAILSPSFKFKFQIENGIFGHSTGDGRRPAAGHGRGGGAVRHRAGILPTPRTQEAAGGEAGPERGRGRGRCHQGLDRWVLSIKFNSSTIDTQTERLYNLKSKKVVAINIIRLFKNVNSCGQLRNDSFG